MKITIKDVEHVAELSRIKFEDDELVKFTEQLGKILAYVDKLNELDTQDVDPTYHVLDLTIPLRDDVLKPMLGAEDALGNAPEEEEGYFTVPKFIED